MPGWIVGDSTKTRWRCMDDLGVPTWTDSPEGAIRYSRRKDAEAAHGQDDEVWYVMEYDFVANKPGFSIESLSNLANQPVVLTEGEINSLKAFISYSRLTIGQSPNNFQSFTFEPEMLALINRILEEKLG